MATLPKRYVEEEVNPFESAISEYATNKSALAQRTEELRMERDLRIDLDNRLHVANEQHRLYKEMIEAELAVLRSRVELLQTYSSAMRTRLSVIKEIIDVAESDAMQFTAEKIKNPQTEAENNAEVAADIREHFERSRKTDAVNDGAAQIVEALREAKQ